MDKNIGFRRNILLSWLDATASLCAETEDLAMLRTRLEPIVGETIASKANRRMAIDILLNIWVKTGQQYPYLRQQALAFFSQSENLANRLWLHFGLTILYDPFFRSAVAIIGQMSRYADTMTSRDVKNRVFAELGQSGALDNAVERVIFSLRDWGMLADADQRYAYRPLRQACATTHRGIECWLLEVALTSHPAQELPFTDLVRLPELFPFRFSVRVDDLRESPRFEVHRQGLGWDMIRMNATVNTSARDQQLVEQSMTA